jgi:hypothetical protein
MAFRTPFDVDSGPGVKRIYGLSGIKSYMRCVVPRRFSSIITDSQLNGEQHTFRRSIAADVFLENLLFNHRTVL